MSSPTAEKFAKDSVHVRREHLDAHAAALVQVHRELVLRVADGGEERGHVLGRVVVLQVGRPVVITPYAAEWALLKA